MTEQRVPQPLPFHRSVFFKAVMVTFACTLFVSASLAAFNYRNAYATAVSEAKEHVGAISPLIARQVVGALRFGKAEPAQEALTALIEGSDGEGLGALTLKSDGSELAQVVAGGNHEVLRETAQAALAQGQPVRSADELTYAMPVESGGAIVGALAISWTAEHMIASVRANLAESLLITALIALATQIAAGWALHRLIARPLTRVNGAMARVAAEDYAVTVPDTRRRDEIGAIATALDSFRQSLAASQEANRVAHLRGAALSAGTTAMMITDNDHRITYVNAAMTQLLRQHSAAIRSSLPDFDPDALIGVRADRLLENGRHAASALDNAPSDLLRIEQDLSSGTLVVSVNPVRDAAGAKIGHVAQWQDITAERDNQAVLDSLDSTQLRAEFSPDGQLLSANTRFCALFGTTIDALRGTRFADQIRLAGADHSALFGPQAAPEGTSGRFELTRDAAQGAVIDGVLNPIRNASGAVLRRLLLGNDVTESVQRLAEAEARRAADHANQQKVVDALRAALSGLSEGDLSMSINTPFPAEYESLRHDYNRAAANLLQTMRCVLDNAESIRGESGQISNAATDLSRRTEQQAATLEQTAAALNQLTASVRSAAEGAARANEMVAQAKTNAETSGQVVREAVLAMSAIEDSSNKISKITSVIDEIAFQTNLLALNAGVEAARAGDAGRGFAVVASEVRALAQRSSDAAREIAGLISSSSSQVKRGVELVGQAGDALGGIQSSVSDIFTCVSDIAVSTREQSSGLSEINTAVHQLDQVTQQNAAMFEQTSAASQSLTREADTLGEAMARFHLGMATTPRSAAHPAALAPATGMRSGATTAGTAGPSPTAAPTPAPAATPGFVSDRPAGRVAPTAPAAGSAAKTTPAPSAAPASGAGLARGAGRLTALAIKPTAEDDWEDF